MNTYPHLPAWIRAVLAAHDAPCLAWMPGGMWCIVTAAGVALSEVCASPYLAWQSAAARLQVTTPGAVE